MELKELDVFLWKEAFSLAFSSFFLGFMFSVFGYRFGVFEITWPSLFFKTSGFVFLVLFVKLLVMKLAGYFEGSKVVFENSLSNIYISLFLFICSFGFLIFPQTWKVSKKNLPHRFVGRSEHIEYGEFSFYTTKFSEHKFSKIIFLGFVVYVVFLLLLKPSGVLSYYFFFVTLWIAFVSLLPALITEGYFLFTTNRFLWISSFTMIVLSFLCSLLIRNAVILLTSFVSILVICIMSLYYDFYLKE